MATTTETKSSPQSANKSQEQPAEQRRAWQQEPADERFTLPAANIYATKDDYIVELEMPGVDKSGLDVKVDGTELVISGRRGKDIPEGELSYCESALANYRRVFEVGPDIDTSKVEAQLSQGVLKLKLPKSERAKPRKIQIQG